MAADPLLTDPFSVRTAADAHDYVIAVYGEVDVLTTPDLVREVERGLASPAAAVVVDLSALRFIDSTGLHAMVVAWRRAQELGKQLRLLQPPPAVHRAFEITGLADALPFAD